MKFYQVYNDDTLTFSQYFGDKTPVYNLYVEAGSVADAMVQVEMSDFEVIPSETHREYSVHYPESIPHGKCWVLMAYPFTFEQMVEREHAVGWERTYAVLFRDRKVVFENLPKNEVHT